MKSTVRAGSFATTEVQRLQTELAHLRRELAACRGREARALAAAHVDALTGLPNRRVFDRSIAVQLASHHARRSLLALLFIDLDGFKAVNDLHGHPVGDALLMLVGRRLRHAMRQQDLACRIGGDEFACVLLDLRSEHELLAIQRQLRDTVARPCQLGALTLTIRPSIGAALFPRDGASGAELLTHADRAMYCGKRQPLTLVPAAGVSARLPVQP